jgi:hypothetical protein
VTLWIGFSWLRCAHFWALVNRAMRKVGCNFMWWGSCVDMCYMLHLSTDAVRVEEGHHSEMPAVLYYRSHRATFRTAVLFIGTALSGV